MWSSHYASLPAVFNLLPTITNWEVFEKQLCNQSSQCEKYRQVSIMQRKPSCATTFLVSKDEWSTDEGIGKSTKNALYVLQYAKRHLSGQYDVKQWKKSSM